MSRYLFAATLAMLAAMTASSGISRLPYRLHPSPAPGRAQLYAIGTRSMAQRHGAAAKLDSVLADLARHASRVRPDHALGDLHALSPAARFTTSKSTDHALGRDRCRDARRRGRPRGRPRKPWTRASVRVLERCGRLAAGCAARGGGGARRARRSARGDAAHGGVGADGPREHPGRFRPGQRCAAHDLSDAHGHGRDRRGALGQLRLLFRVRGEWQRGAGERLRGLCVQRIHGRLRDGRVHGSAPDRGLRARGGFLPGLWRAGGVPVRRRGPSHAADRACGRAGSEPRLLHGRR